MLHRQGFAVVGWRGDEDFLEREIYFYDKFVECKKRVIMLVLPL